MRIDLIETSVPERDLGLVPFGRSRMLALLSGTLLSVAFQVAAPRQAQAAHGSYPYPCFGFGVCHCCSGSTCCESGCDFVSAGCPSGSQCWYTCDCFNLYHCCDWSSSSGTCVCSGLVRSCVGDPC